MPNPYGIIIIEDIFFANQSKYLITQENCIHRMGEVTLEMPVGHFRMPFKGGTEYAGFSWLQENGIENTFFCERIDVTIDDTLKLVYVKATEHAQCKSCSRKRYVLNLLKPCDGEVVVQRTSFPFNSGEVHIFTSAPTIQITEATGLYYGSYQAVYFLYGIGNGPAIKLQHGITAQQYFCTKQFESSEFPYPFCEPIFRCLTA